MGEATTWAFAAEEYEFPSLHVETIDWYRDLMKPRAVTIADLDVDGGNCEQLQKCDHLLLDRKTTQT